MIDKLDVTVGSYRGQGAEIIAASMGLLTAAILGVSIKMQMQYP